MRKILIIPFILLLVLTAFFGLITFAPDLITADWYLKIMTWALGVDGLSVNSPIKLISSELFKNWSYVCFGVMVLATITTFAHVIGAFKKNKKANRHGKISKIGAVSIAAYILTIIVTALALSYFLIAVAAIALITLIMVSTIPNNGSLATAPVTEENKEEDGAPIFDNLASAEDSTYSAEIVSELKEIENMDNHVYVQPTPIAEEPETSITYAKEVSFEDMVNESQSDKEEVSTPNFAPVVEEEPVQAIVEEPQPVSFNDILSNAKSHYQPYQPISEPNFAPVVEEEPVQAIVEEPQPVSFNDILSNAKSHYQPYQPIQDRVQPEPVYVPEPQPVQPEPIYIPQPEPVNMNEIINSAKSHYQPYQPIQDRVQPEPVYVPEPQPVQPQQTVFVQTPEPVYVPQPQPVFIPKTELVFVPVQSEPIFIDVQNQQPVRTTAERVELLRQLTNAPQFSEEELYYHPQQKAPAPVYRQPFAKKAPAQLAPVQPQPTQQPTQTQQPPAPIIVQQSGSKSKTESDAYREELRKKLLSRIK